MKQSSLGFVSFVALLTLLAAGCATTELRRKGPPPADAARVELSITGMSCQSCVMRVTNALNRTSGVYACQVTLKPPRARVTFDAKATNAKAMIAKVNALGYKAMVHRSSARSSR